MQSIVRRGGRAGQLADGGDPVAGDGHIGRRARAARAVDDGAAGKQQIEQGVPRKS